MVDHPIQPQFGDDRADFIILLVYDALLEGPGCDDTLIRGSGNVQLLGGEGGYRPHVGAHPRPEGDA